MTGGRTPGRGYKKLMQSEDDIVGSSSVPRYPTRLTRRVVCCGARALPIVACLSRRVLEAVVSRIMTHSRSLVAMYHHG